MIKRIKIRWEKWKDWRLYTIMNDFSAFLVFLGIKHSPSFESWRPRGY